MLSCMRSSTVACEDYCNRLAAIFREHDRLTELWTKGLNDKIYSSFTLAPILTSVSAWSRRANCVAAPLSGRLLVLFWLPFG